MDRRTLISACLIGCAFLPMAGHADGPLPADATIVHGDITITTSSDVQMMVQQSGQAGIIDWGSFSVDQGASVDFQNSSGATLNRVTGSDLSSIMGSVTATGSVYVINQNGIIIGETGQVNTGGRFVASTLDLGNEDFLNGGDNVFAGDSAATVINLGQISSLGGDVSLMARRVVNEGTITAPGGTVGLVAGREILMRDASVADGMFSVRIGGSDTSVSDAGSIAAAAAELRANGGNVYALAGNTQGTIAATGVAKVDGRVFLTAGDAGKVHVTKQVKATSADGSGGRMDVFGGSVDMAGTLDASGTSGGIVVINSAVETMFSGTVLAFGDDIPESGGFVEVSGRHLTFAGSVDTGGGTVLIDPDNIQIAEISGTGFLGGASQILTSTLDGLLATQEVIVQTTGTDGEAGTILISADLFYESDFSLTLLAHGDIIATNSIQNSGSGDINLVAGWEGTTSTSAFDPTPFDTADLASQTLFGNASGVSYIFNSGFFIAQGSVEIGTGDQFNTVAIGSADGATRVYSGDLELNGLVDPIESVGSAQLGFTLSSPSVTSVTGDIFVRATGDIFVSGGDNGGGSAQIGHVGAICCDFGLSVDVDSAITIEALGEMSLLSGSGIDDYAMVGHGSLTFIPPDLTLQGDITVTLGDELSLDQSAGASSFLGHRGLSLDSVSNADVLITAAALDDDADTFVGAGGTGILDIVRFEEILSGGDVTVIVTDSGLALVDDTFDFCCIDVNTQNDLVIQAANDITLEPGFLFGNTGGGSVALAAGENFENNSGGTGFGDMGGGVWVVYSTRPDLNTDDIGVMDADIIGWGTVFDINNPFTGSGLFASGLNYYVTPQITIADIGTTYGAPISPVVSVTVDGIAINPADFGFSVTSGFIDSSSVSFSGDGFVNAGSYAQALTAENASTVAAAHLGITTDRGDLEVGAATISVVLADQTKPYDGIGYTVPVTYAGFVGTDDETILTAGPAFHFSGGDGSGVNVGTYLVFAGGFAEASGNYVFVADTANLTITPLTLSASLIGAMNKVYDGTTNAALTLGNFALTGFIAGEGAGVTETNGTFASANVSASTLVTTTLSAADFAANPGTLLSNYLLPVSAIGNGSIDRALLTASIVGNPSKLFDDTTLATLTAANFELAGLVAGEGATINQTTGAYSGSAVGTDILVTASLAPDNFDANTRTLLSNYILPLSASGTGSIVAPTQSVPPVQATRGVEPLSTTSLVLETETAVGLELISTETTQRIVDEINAGVGFCKQLVREEYLVDCLSERLQVVADGLSAVGEYSEVRAALDDAAQKLRSLALSNIGELPQAVHRTPNRSSSRPLTAVSQASLASVNAQAVAIIESTELVLLRSGENSERRRDAYERISAVVDSTKVLLRSS